MRLKLDLWPFEIGSTTDSSLWGRDSDDGSGGIGVLRMLSGDSLLVCLLILVSGQGLLITGLLAVNLRRRFSFARTLILVL